MPDDRVASALVARRGDTQRALRVGLLVLAMPPSLLGLWASLDPAGFFAAFPGLGLHWVDLLPPYNEHLVRDVGGLCLGQAVLLLVAAAWPERTLVRAALIASLATAVPHLLFHVTHVDGWGASDAILQAATLGVPAVLPAVLLLLDVRRSGTYPPARARPAANSSEGV